MLNQGSCKIRLGKAVDVLRKLEQRPQWAAYFGMAGPDSVRLKQGWALYQAAFDAYYHRAAKRADALAVIDRCAVSFQAARALQTRITALARVLITAPSHRDRLGLSGRRAEGLAGWRVQAEIFHANLTDADRHLLAEVGVDTAMLDRAAALLAQLAIDHAARVAAKAQAKAASEAKAEAFQALAAYMSVLINIARALEADVPDLIAFLGMSPDRRRHRSASVLAETHGLPTYDGPDEAALEPGTAEIGPPDAGTAPSNADRASSSVDTTGAAVPGLTTPSHPKSSLMPATEAVDQAGQERSVSGKRGSQSKRRKRGRRGRSRTRGVHS